MDKDPHCHYLQRITRAIHLQLDFLLQEIKSMCLTCPTCMTANFMWCKLPYSDLLSKRSC